MIVHTFDKDGGFIAGDTDTGLTCYAYPSSTHATQAKRASAKVAAKMMKNERSTVHDRSEYDGRHWAKLNAVFTWLPRMRGV